MIIDATKYRLKDGTYDLMKMRTAMAIKNQPHYTINFPPGEIKYLNNRWLFGIRSFEIVGNDSILRSIYSGNDDAFQRPLFVGELFQNNVLAYTGEKKYVTADRIKPAKAGADIIELDTYDNHYYPGDRVLLYAGNYADSGYPPPASAEWHEIDAVFSPINKIKLKRPLEKNYPGNVWDNPGISGGGCGLPRIINLDRSENPYCKYAKFTGITFGNATGGGKGNVIFPAERLEMVRCKGEGYFWPSENRIATFEDMDVNEVEFDKLVNTVICTRVTFKGSPNGGGSVDKIVINDCQAGESMRFDPRVLEIRNTHIRGNDDPDSWICSLADYPARNPIRRIIIDSLTFSSGDKSKADAHINVAPFNAMRVSVNSAGEISTKDFEHVKTIEPGTTIMFAEDGSNGGLVTNISHNGTWFLITGNWNRPEAGTIWRWSHVKEVTDLGGHRVLDGKQLWHNNSIRWKGNQSAGPIKTMNLNQDDFTGNRLIDIYGFLISVKIFGEPSKSIEIQNADPFGTIPFGFEGYKWVKQLYLIGTGGRFDIIVEWKPF